MVDEADKAPAEVVCILKGLLEDGEILLPDGRRFVTSRSTLWHSSDKSCVRVAAGFRVIALANRPGFPFLGNDLFAELGDSFACHLVGNPDRASELQLLESYAPTVRAMPPASYALRCAQPSRLLLFRLLLFRCRGLCSLDWSVHLGG